MNLLHPLTEGRPRPRAFTLIELLVVIAIIAILAALSMGTFQYAQINASRNRTSTGLAAIVNAMEQYKEKFGDYPEPTDDNSRGSGSASRLRIGGALMLYQAISGDGYDNIKDADKTSPTGSAASDGRVDESERNQSIRGDLPKTMILNSTGGYMLVDGFGHPYQYEKGGGQNAVNVTFDAWSYAQLNPEKDLDKVSSDISVKKDPKKSAVWISSGPNRDWRLHTRRCAAFASGCLFWRS
jgi:prepilin-type N-terminal cleavage/methylation domain-containing protein